MSASFEKAERKYLDTHAEPEVALCGALDSAQRGYGHVLAIPAAGEADELERTLASLPDGPLGPVLTIVVVNATPDAPAWVQQSNAQTLETFGRRKDRAQRLTPRATLYAGEGGDVLVLDRATRGHQLPPGQGVGLARKIGVDLALALVLTGRVASPWIHVSAADVRFPEDYFHQVLEDRGGSSSALLYRFQHRPIGDARSYDAALQYEAALRYYVTGLRFAGSRYAFHSIGSTLVLRASAYAQVRGFPRRQAAEEPVRAGLAARHHVAQQCAPLGVEELVAPQLAEQQGHRAGRGGVPWVGVEAPGGRAPRLPEQGLCDQGTAQWHTWFL